MNLRPVKLDQWPKLAWLARCADGAETVDVYHGPHVETGGDFCVEAVWAGEFADGDFDATELVFGSGVRCRGGEVVFVSSGTVLDRLWHCRHNGLLHVSNSLPVLLASAGLSLRDDYRGYPADIATVRLGLGTYRRSIPTTGPDANVVYFSNLTYDGRALTESDKPQTAPHFGCFADYRDFLTATAERLGRNAASPLRKFRITPLATISKGFDSPVSAAISRAAGCNQTVTITRATSVWGWSDSGEEIARRLGMSCLTYGREAAVYPSEEAIWAVGGRCMEMNWTQFDYPAPLCLLITACHGDLVWEERRVRLDDPLASASIAGMGICEFRLLRGVFHCPLPYWGICRIAEIQEINRSAEMSPWRLGGDYDRPIPRRIIEEAGVPRGTFGRRKMNTQSWSPVSWPYSPAAGDSFRRFLRVRGIAAPGDAEVAIRRSLCTLDFLAARNVLRRPWLNLRLHHRISIAQGWLLFQWANQQLRDRCSPALASAIAASR